MVNQLVSNVKWSQKSNFVDIPTDCPTRERVGWTADISVFAETACYLTHPRQFLTKWLQDYMKAMIYPDTEVTTAWFFKTTTQLAEMAAILGHEKDYQKFHALSCKLKEVYKRHFLKKDRVASKRQCKYVRPLSMHLVDGTAAETIAAKLNEICIAGEYKIGTGFLTTWQVLQVLTDYGYADTAYRMLENTKQPGWLYAVSKGATTVWENWEGITKKGEPVDSHNHYAPGAVVAWLFSHCAGIRPLKPGFEEVLIRPFSGGSLTFARAEYESCKGTIVSEWKRDGDVFMLQVEIPDGVHARIELPDESHDELFGGKGEWSVPFRSPAIS